MRGVRGSTVLQRLVTKEQVWGLDGAIGNQTQNLGFIWLWLGVEQGRMRGGGGGESSLEMNGLLEINVLLLRNTPF